MREINHLILHHSKNYYSFQDYVKIQREVLGKSFLEYHFFVDIKGRISNGLSCEICGKDNKAISVCLLGNMNEAEMSNKQFTSLIGLLYKLSREHKIGIMNIRGHSEIENVKCPGENIKMDEVRKNVKLKMMNKIKLKRTLNAL